jgi:anti-anti-sigma factor
VDIMNDGTTLVLRGDFDGRSTSVVRDVLYDRLNCEQVLVVDMGEVAVVDLIALRLLVVATRHASREGRLLILRNCRPRVLRMIHLAKVAHAVHIERAAA